MLYLQFHFYLWYNFGNMALNRSKNFLKAYCKKKFVCVFRHILYDKDLSWPQKGLLMALLDQPSRRHGVYSIISNKFDRPASSIASWKAKIEKLEAFNHILEGNLNSVKT